VLKCLLNDVGFGSSWQLRHCDKTRLKEDGDILVVGPGIQMEVYQYE